VLQCLAPLRQMMQTFSWHGQRLPLSQMQISAAIYPAISYMNCVAVKSQEAVVVLIAPGSELEPAKRGEVLSGNVDRPRTAAEIVRDREAINIRALRGRKLRDSRFQVAVKSIGFTEIGRLGVGPCGTMYHMLSDRGFLGPPVSCSSVNRSEGFDVRSGRRRADLL
jgi:hypothetical protein